MQPLETMLMIATDGKQRNYADDNRWDPQKHLDAKCYWDAGWAKNTNLDIRLFVSCFLSFFDLLISLGQKQGDIDGRGNAHCNEYISLYLPGQKGLTISLLKVGQLFTLAYTTESSRIPNKITSKSGLKRLNIEKETFNTKNDVVGTHKSHSGYLSCSNLPR